ncbi:MAG: ERAP1-like C-terminal domain-containing protein [Acidobacteria bacterium]|nr:ERAP1-like C-terminal domain-containing protein [Acidobacteriota bacterium]
MKLSRLALFPLFLCLQLPVFAQDAPAVPKLRLPAGARPLHYEVELTLRPSAPRFSGRIDIDVALDAATPVIWLNASDLEISKATYLPAGAAASGVREARVVPGGKDFAGFAFAEPLPQGNGRLSVTYTGEVNLKDTAGVFAQKEGDDWYLYTQFEATDARRAFPCFDEPTAKVPWRLTLLVPKDLVAVSNTPIVSEAPEGGDLRKVVFGETKPLPSYLIAFGVGPFDIVDAGRACKARVPVRILTPRGRAAEAAYAVEVTAELLTRLEDYFGIPFPYEKLDNLVIPTTVGFGAMENAGLVTWASNLSLAKPDAQSIGFMRTYASISAHESAHQWFGDLVTMAWWDDLWLNESFATWMASRLLDKWKPEWNERIEAIAGRDEVMREDSLVSARQIHQPIEAKDDIANAFDGITYGKGGAVLRMFESYLGEEVFRKGVQRYLKKHAFGNATAADFLGALAAEGGAWVAPAFATFLDQPGVPVITPALSCGPNGAKLTLTQKRLLPRGSTGSREAQWRIPLCVRAEPAAGGDPPALALPVCTVLTQPTGEIALGSACPARVVVNEGGAGYFRVAYPADLRNRLVKGGATALSTPERLSLLQDAAALAETGDVPRADALRLVPVFAGDQSRLVVAAAAGIADSIDLNLVPDALRPNYARFIQKSFGEKARSLGFAPKAGAKESEDLKLLRADVVPLVARLGSDRALSGEAGRLARAWLTDRSAVDPNMLGSVLNAAARSGDRALFDRFLAETKTTKERRDRRRLLPALTLFPDSTLVSQALALTLDEALDPRESLSTLITASRQRETREAALGFVEKNFDALAARLPRDVPANFPYVASTFCDEAHRTRVATYFKDRSPKYTGGPRILEQTLEGIALCAAARRDQQSGVEAFLSGY